MSKNRNKNSNYKDDAPQATITDGSEKQDSKNAAASAVSADGEDLISLHIRRTNDEPGFRALNPYVRKRLYELTVAYIDKLCERSNFKVDKPYWKKIGGEIIDTGTADEVLIADARAGYGKSTFINAFVLSLIELSRENKECRSELGGLVISFQKVEDLNRLVNLVGEFFGDIFGAAWTAFPDANSCKIGYTLRYTLDDGSEIRYTMLSPKHIEHTEYIECWLYDDYHREPHKFYSHLKPSSMKSETLITSIKLTAGKQISHVTDLWLTAFICASLDEFDANRNYTGPPSCTLHILRTGS